MKKISEQDVAVLQQFHERLQGISPFDFAAKREEICSVLEKILDHIEEDSDP